MGSGLHDTRLFASRKVDISPPDSAIIGFERNEQFSTQDIFTRKQAIYTECR